MTNEPNDPTRFGAPVADAGARLSLPEIETLCLKAARGAGMDWGLAEEAGFAARWLAARGLPGPELLLAHLEARSGQPWADVGPRASGDWRARGGGALCPVSAGAAFSDHAVGDGRTARFEALSRPLLIVPFLCQSLAGEDDAVVVSGKGSRIVLSPAGICEGSDLTALSEAESATVEVSPCDAAPVVNTRPSGRLIDHDCWQGAGCVRVAHDGSGDRTVARRGRGGQPRQRLTAPDRLPSGGARRIVATVRRQGGARMTARVDLNSDMGEAFGRWSLGDDAVLLDIVTSANIACGFHAGDPDVMAATMRMAVEKDVGIGAHPGFPDLQGFGRRKMNMPAESLANAIRYQVGAAQAMARVSGGAVRHLKLHGALSNMASVDAGLARTCYEAALEVQPDLIIMVLAATAMEEVVKDLGCAYAAEIFADRAYEDDATLVDRAKPGAVIHDPGRAAERMVEMVTEGAIIAESGKRIPTRIDTICLHGDTAEAVGIARAVRAALETAGIAVRRF